jgi:Metallopeptidase family M24
MRCAGRDRITLRSRRSSPPALVPSSFTPRRAGACSRPAISCTWRSAASRLGTTPSGLQTLHVGGAPPPRVGVHLYGIAQACLRAGLDAITPGIEARAVEAPALAILRDAGLGDGFMMRFGYGVGVGYPPTWLDPLQITRTSTQPLMPGTTFVLHACLLDEQAQVGVVVGGTYAVGEAGVETLAGAGPVELVTT